MHSVGFQLPPLLTQPLNSMDISFSTSSILGTDWFTNKGPTAKNKQQTMDCAKGALKGWCKKYRHFLGKSQTL